VCISKKSVNDSTTLDTLNGSYLPSRYLNIMDAGRWELFAKDANVSTAGYSQGISNLSKCFSSDKRAQYNCIAANA